MGFVLLYPSYRAQKPSVSRSLPKSPEPTADLACWRLRRCCEGEKDKVHQVGGQNNGLFGKSGENVLMISARRSFLMAVLPIPDA